MFLKIREASFILFLWHIISSKGVKIDPAKVEAITKMLLPNSVNELQGFYHLYHRQVAQRQDKK